MENLKLLRTSLGMSQQKLASILGVSQQSIYKYENGLAEPDIAMLKQMARYFGTSIDYIVGYVPDIVLEDDGVDGDETHIESIKLSAPEIRHIVSYRNLTDNMKQNIDSIMEDLIEKK